MKHLKKWFDKLRPWIGMGRNDPMNDPKKMKQTKRGLIIAMYLVNGTMIAMIIMTLVLLYMTKT